MGSFEDMVGGNVTKDFQLPIPMENRYISVPAYGTDMRGAKVARFTFEDLCVKNMGRADYSVIAENYHTLFVEGVPKFKPDLGAEFRRFISLTDILMDELWGFRRCSSMLSEMQNPKYHHMVWLMR